MSSFFIDITQALTFLVMLQYFAIPILFFVSLKGSEKVKFEVINAARIDALLTITEKLSHDIRSPLSSINLIVNSSKGIEDDKKDLIFAAAKRIDDIANNILDKQKNSYINFYNILETVNLNLSILAVVKEKKILNEKINYHVNINSNLNAIVSKVEFERVISNIIDNSIFSLNEVISPEIKIQTLDFNNSVALEIQDNGCGMSKDILGLIGRVKVTTKLKVGADTNSSGNGIGLLNAKRTIEKMNGAFEIFSSDKGTTVKLMLIKGMSGSVIV